MTKERPVAFFMNKEKSHHYGVFANNLTLSAGTKDLIKNANFSIYPERKMALIGRNGSGKSTLLETVYRLSQKIGLPEGVEVEGSLNITEETTIGYLPQSVQIEFSGTVGEYLDSSVEKVARVFNRYNEITEALNENQETSLLEEYGELLDQMNLFNAWDFPNRRRLVLEGFGLSEHYLTRDIKEVSGGEATKVALAGILLASPNLILLDEPTNNLDVGSLLFLEKWIEEFPFSLLLVSHDRDFLDKVADEILEIDEATKHVILFGGNYSFYAKKKKELFEAQLRHYEEQQRKRKQLEEEVDRLRKEAKKFESKSTDSFYRAKGAAIAKRGRVQLQRVERELTKIPEPQPPKKPQITVFEVENNLGSTLLQVKDAEFSYLDQERILADISFSIKSGERVGIIGPNGAGKSTFVKLLAGELQLQKGVVNRSQEIRLVYLPQTLYVAGTKQSPVDFLRERVPMREEEARTLLGKVLFADPSFMRIKDFSFGELRRVELVALFASKPNLIVLDEPTNHLDIYTIEMFEEALKSFKGAVLAVSHDQRFLENIEVSRLLIFKNGKVEEKRLENIEKIGKVFESTFISS